MKRFSLVISILVLFAVSLQVTSAANYWDLTSYQQQKYWNMWEQDCQSLLMNQQYTQYLTCALDVMEKASKLVEAKEAWCSDSDGGIDWLKKGTVKSDLNPGGVEDYIYTFGDGSQYLFEGACSDDNHYFYYQQNCAELGPKYVADVTAGACVLKNAAPVIEAIGDKTVKEGELLTFVVKASDADGDALTWSAEGLPAGAKFEGGVFEWTPGITQAGQYFMTVTVDDGMVKVVKQIKIIVENLPTEFCGIVSQNTVLTKVQSPYLVKCHILVEKGVTLTIEPGVEVRFDGPYYLRVDGTLKADGTKDQMILFTSNKSDPKPGDWGPIRFEDSSVDWDGASGSVVRYAKLEYGGDFYPNTLKLATILTMSASPLIENNEITKFYGYGVYGVASAPKVIKNNTFSDGKSGGINVGGSAIYVEGNSEIKGNKITINNPQGSMSGIICDGGSALIENNYIINTSTTNNNNTSGISCGGINSVVIKGNTIKNNDQYGIIAGGSASVIDNIVTNNAKGIFTFGPATIMNNTVSDNKWGVQISGTGTKVTNNSISNNLDIGILVEGSGSVISKNTITGNKKGVALGTSSLSLSNNNIYNNSEYLLYLLPYAKKSFSGDINVANNYWGTTNTASIDKMIFDFYDDFDLPKVIYKPIADSIFVW